MGSAPPVATAWQPRLAVCAQEIRVFANNLCKRFPLRKIRQLSSSISDGQSSVESGNEETRARLLSDLRAMPSQPFGNLSPLIEPGPSRSNPRDRWGEVAWASVACDQQADAL